VYGLAVGFLVATATHPDALPNDPIPAAGRLIGNAASGLFLLGWLMVPAALVHLATLAVFTRRWSPTRQRIAALVLSPLVTWPVWFTGTSNAFEAVVFAIGIPQRTA